MATRTRVTTPQPSRKIIKPAQSHLDDALERMKRVYIAQIQRSDPKPQKVKAT